MHAGNKNEIKTANIYDKTKLKTKTKQKRQNKIPIYTQLIR